MWWGFHLIPSSFHTLVTQWEYQFSGLLVWWTSNAGWAANYVGQQVVPPCSQGNSHLGTTQLCDVSLSLLIIKMNPILFRDRKWHSAHVLQWMITQLKMEFRCLTYRPLRMIYCEWFIFNLLLKQNHKIPKRVMSVFWVVPRWNNFMFLAFQNAIMNQLIFWLNNNCFPGTFLI